MDITVCRRHAADGQVEGRAGLPSGPPGAEDGFTGVSPGPLCLLAPGAILSTAVASTWRLGTRGVSSDGHSPVGGRFAPLVAACALLPSPRTPVPRREGPHGHVQAPVPSTEAS